MADVNWVKVAAYMAAGICMGFGGFGPSIGQGLIAGKTCEAIGKKPEAQGALVRTMVLGMAFTETASIFSLLVSLILLFVVAN